MTFFQKGQRIFSLNLLSGCYLFRSRCCCCRGSAPYCRPISGRCRSLQRCLWLWCWSCWLCFSLRSCPCWPSCPWCGCQICLRRSHHRPQCWSPDRWPRCCCPCSCCHRPNCRSSVCRCLYPSSCRRPCCLCCCPSCLCCCPCCLCSLCRCPSCLCCCPCCLCRCSYCCPYCWPCQLSVPGSG